MLGSSMVYEVHATRRRLTPGIFYVWREERWRRVTLP